MKSAITKPFRCSTAEEIAADDAAWEEAQLQARLLAHADEHRELARHRGPLKFTTRPRGARR